MIFSDALRAWRADGEAQARTVAAVEDFRRRFVQLPALTALRRELDEVRQGGADPILGVARRFMENSEAAGSCLDPMIEAARADPFFRPPLRTGGSDVHSGLLLLDDPALAILLAVMPVDALAAKRTHRSGPASIAFTGQRAIYHFVRAGGALLSLWEAPEIRPGFSAQASGRCRLVERRLLRDGETIALDGRRHGFVIDHAQSDLVYLHATTPAGAGPLMAEYDSQTLSFVGASSTDDASSRIQMMLALLRVMDRRDAAPVFRDMLSSPHFYARWQAMREFLGLDADLALPHLKTMSEADPHPEVREAAVQTLASFFPEDLRAEEEAEALCPA